MCRLRSGICKLSAFRFGKTALKEGLKPEANKIFHRGLADTVEEQ